MLLADCLLIVCLSPITLAPLNPVVQKPDSGIVAPYGSTEFLQTVNELSFLGTELHSTYGPLFNPTLTPEARAAQTEKLMTKFKRLEAKLAGKVRCCASPANDVWRCPCTPSLGVTRRSTSSAASSASPTRTPTSASAGTSTSASPSTPSRTCWRSRRASRPCPRWCLRMRGLPRCPRTRPKRLKCRFGQPACAALCSKPEISL